MPFDSSSWLLSVAALGEHRIGIASRDECSKYLYHFTPRSAMGGLTGVFRRSASDLCDNVLSRKQRMQPDAIMECRTEIYAVIDSFVARGEMRAHSWTWSVRPP